MGLSLPRRLAKPFLVLLALTGLAAALSACAVYKLGSLQLSQPGGIGSVRVHFLICTEPETEEDGTTNCAVNKSEGQIQSIVGIAVPPGSGAPAAVTATPLQGGPPIVFARNDQAAQSLAQSTAGGGKPWPPAGSEGIGYISAPVTEEKGALREWSFDADFGLPTAADGGPFGGPFAAAIAYGVRGVGGDAGPAERPVACVSNPLEASDDSAFCASADSAQISISNLRIGSPPRAAAFVGGQASFAFPMEFAGTPPKLIDFRLTASSNLAKARVVLDTTSHVPGPPAAGTNRSPVVSRIATVTVPRTAKPGRYDVTLTATAPEGGTVSQVAKLKVTKAKIGLGGVKLNKTKGIATLSVKIPGAGTVTATGKGIAKVTKSAKRAKKPKTLKLTIKARGKAKKQLAEEGTAKVSVKITFKPSSGTPVTKTKKITLKLNP